MSLLLKYRPGSKRLERGTSVNQSLFYSYIPHLAVVFTEERLAPRDNLHCPMSSAPSSSSSSSRTKSNRSSSSSSLFSIHFLVLSSAAILAIGLLLSAFYPAIASTYISNLQNTFARGIVFSKSQEAKMSTRPSMENSNGEWDSFSTLKNGNKSSEDSVLRDG